MTTILTEHRCPRCKGRLVFVTKNPEQGSGCIIAVLGLILAPVLLGIPLLIYGLKMSSRQEHYWHCQGCGTVFPAAIDAVQTTPK